MQISQLTDEEFSDLLICDFLKLVKDRNNMFTFIRPEVVFFIEKEGYIKRNKEKVEFEVKNFSLTKKGQNFLLLKSFLLMPETNINNFKKYHA